MNADLAGWRFHDVRLRCHGRVAPLAQHRLLARLRGRLGQNLHGRISTAWYESLFPESGDRPPPFVLRIDGCQAPVLVARLFGRAIVLADAVAEALEALAADGLLVPGGARPLFPAGAATQMSGEAAPRETAASAVTLRSVTPLCLALAAEPSAESLLHAIARRLANLAPWLGGASVPGLPEPGALTAAVSLQPCDWTRIAHRQGSRGVPMTGWRGEIRLTGRLADLTGLLAVAECCHIGRHASFGMGRFEIMTAC